MAVNERVEYTSGDVNHEQLAPSQASRTEYYPGKSSSRQGDMNFERDFRIPTGTPAFDGESAGPVKMEYSRVAKLGRNIVDDQVINVPQTGTPVTTVVDDDAVWGTGADPEHTLTPTATEEVNVAGHQRDKENVENTTGYNNIQSA